MAKTKGSNPPLRELIYEDAAGEQHFFGEFFRMIFREGSISQRDPEIDITGQSQRGLRPTQQGEGTGDQKANRQAFSNCALLWNSLPEKCPVPLPDPPPTSLESVYQAKLDLGVVCSYYDLFMRCCMDFALAHGGAMPTNECFPCEEECDCEGISIGYTTQGMQVDEEQNLSVIGDQEGCTYNWSLSGGGSLSSPTGTHVIYIAPSENPNCDENATITLSVEGITCDTLEIAVNENVGAEHAYGLWTGAIYQQWFFFKWYYCDVTQAGGGSWETTPEMKDVRTEEMIAAGCCPEELL